MTQFERKAKPEDSSPNSSIPKCSYIDIFEELDSIIEKFKNQPSKFGKNFDKVYFHNSFLFTKLEKELSNSTDEHANDYACRKITDYLSYDILSWINQTTVKYFFEIIDFSKLSEESIEYTSSAIIKIFRDYPLSTPEAFAFPIYKIVETSLKRKLSELPTTYGTLLPALNNTLTGENMSPYEVAMDICTKEFGFDYIENPINNAKDNLQKSISSTLPICPKCGKNTVEQLAVGKSIIEKIFKRIKPRYVCKSCGKRFR